MLIKSAQAVHRPNKYMLIKSAQAVHRPNKVC